MEKRREVSDALTTTGHDSTDDMERGIRHLLRFGKCLVFPIVLVNKRKMLGGVGRVNMSDNQQAQHRLEVFRRLFPARAYTGRPQSRPVVLKQRAIQVRQPCVHGIVDEFLSNIPIADQKTDFQDCPRISKRRT